MAWKPFGNTSICDTDLMVVCRKSWIDEETHQRRGEKLDLAPNLLFPWAVPRRGFDHSVEPSTLLLQLLLKFRGTGRDVRPSFKFSAITVESASIEVSGRKSWIDEEKHQRWRQKLDLWPHILHPWVMPHYGLDLFQFAVQRLQGLIPRFTISATRGSTSIGY